MAIKLKAVTFTRPIRSPMGVVKTCVADHPRCIHAGLVMEWLPDERTVLLEYDHSSGRRTVRVPEAHALEMEIDVVPREASISDYPDPPKRRGRPPKVHAQA